MIIYVYIKVYLYTHITFLNTYTCTHVFAKCNFSIAYKNVKFFLHIKLESCSQILFSLENLFIIYNKIFLW